MKKLFTLFFALVASVGTLFAARVKIGDLYYNLDETNKTAEVTYSSTSQDNYYGLTSVVIPASVEYNSANYSVTSIGFFAFYFCRTVTNVTIPNSVTKIDGQAFFFSNTLEAINVASDNPAYYAEDGVLFNKGKTLLLAYPMNKQGAYVIPNTVTSLGEYAFFACEKLTSITLPQGVTSFGEDVFDQCFGLTAFNVATDNSAYYSEDGVLYNKDKTKILIYPPSKQGDYSILSSVKSIEQKAFYWAKALTGVIIPQGVISIGGSAFSGCTSLSSIEIPSSVTSIGESAFSGCTGVTSIICRATTPPTCSGEVFYNVSTSIPLYVPSGSVTTYKKNSPWSDFNVQAISGAVTIDIDVTWLETGGSGLGEITTNNTGVWTYDSKYGAVGKKQSATGYLMTPAIDLREMKDITLSFQHTHKFATTPSDELTLWVTSNFTGEVSTSTWERLTINPYASNSDWTFVDVSVNVPVAKVGAKTVFAFKYMSSGTKYATWEIKNLKLTATSGVVSGGKVQIGDLYYNLNAVNKSAEVTYHMQNSQNNYSYLNDVTIPASVVYNDVTYKVTGIGDSAFYWSREMTSVSVPNSVTYIGRCAFWWSSNVTSISLGTGVYSIGYGAFSGCEKLASVNLPNKLTSIGERAFTNCVALASINIPNGIVSIRDNTFYGCSNLTSINIPNSVTSIGENAFYGCSGMTSLTIGNNVASIEFGAFRGCSSLTSVTIPSSVSSMNNAVFAECTSMKTVIINSDAIVNKKYAGKDTNLTAILDVSADYVIGENITGIGDNAFLMGSMTSLEISNSVKSIGEYAFSSCQNLRTITIPNSVISIKEGAFMCCEDVDSLTIGTSVTSIGYGAFASCKAIKCITSKAITPPTCEGGVFNNVNKSIPLYVPAGSVAAYKAADQWKEFYIIGQAQGIEDANIHTKSVKTLKDGQVIILRGEKTYTLTGQEIK